MKLLSINYIFFKDMLMSLGLNVVVSVEQAVGGLVFRVGVCASCRWQFCAKVLQNTSAFSHVLMGVVPLYQR